MFIAVCRQNYMRLDLANEEDNKWRREEKKLLRFFHCRKVLLAPVAVATKILKELYIKEYTRTSIISCIFSYVIMMEISKTVEKVLCFFFFLQLACFNINNSNIITAYKQKSNHFSYNRNWNSVMHGAHSNKLLGFFFYQSHSDEIFPYAWLPLWLLLLLPLLELTEFGIVEYTKDLK